MDVSYTITITPLGENTSGVTRTQNTTNTSAEFTLVTGEAYQACVITTFDPMPTRRSTAICINFTVPEAGECYSCSCSQDWFNPGFTQSDNYCTF